MTSTGTVHRLLISKTKPNCNKSV